jgi:hypothetical protein
LHDIHFSGPHAVLAGDMTDTPPGITRPANSGRVSNGTWDKATGSGWSDEQLAETFAYLGLTVFTSYFLNYAATELDIPSAMPGSSAPGAG